jgi:hypothetical protein
MIETGGQTSSFFMFYLVDYTLGKEGSVAINTLRRGNMELTFTLFLQFFLLGAATLFLSGLITFLMPKFPISVLILFSSMAGYIFTASNQLTGLIIFTAILNSFLALTSAWIVKYGQYIKRMAEKYKNVTA